MRVAIGSDHAGYEAKTKLICWLKNKGHEVYDCGCDSSENPVPYSIYGFAVAKMIQDKLVDRGIVLCGSGIGIGNAVSKCESIRCCVANSVEDSCYSRRHYDCNVVSCGAREHCVCKLKLIIKTFLCVKYSHKNDKLISELDALGHKINIKEINDILGSCNKNSGSKISMPKILLKK